jgi:UDP-N-acetylmuramate-alanine ligase
LAEVVQNWGRKVVTFASVTAIRDYLTKHAAPGDAIVTFGAGDIWKLYDEYFLR